MMKKLLWIPAMLLAAGAHGQDDGPKGTVALHEPESPFVAFNVWVKVGSQNDPAGKEGLAALTANLLSDGSTSADSYDAILKKLYPMAAGYGYNVDKEMTVFTGRVHVDNLEEYYALFRNSILSPAFKPEDFERVKSQMMNYLQRTRRFGRDEELSKELLYSLAYQGTAYAHPEEGYVQSVESITLEDVKSFYRSHYLANGIVVGIGGGYPEGFVERVRQDFDGLPRGEFPEVPEPRPEMPEGIQVLIVEKPTDATAISIGFPHHLLRGEPDFFGMMAMNSWFGEHRNSFSHLYQVIREERGMNYGDYSYIEAFPLGYTTQQPPVNIARRSHVFEIWIRPISSTAPGNLHDRTLFATRAALRELDHLVEKGLTAEQLAETQRFLHNYSVNWGNTISRRLAYAIDDRFYGLTGDGFLSSIRPGLQALDLHDVNEAIKRHLQTDNMYMVFITSDAEDFKAKLLSGEPTPITYAGEKPPELLAEDEEIAAFPIPVKEEDIRIIGINEVYESALNGTASH